MKCPKCNGEMEEGVFGGLYGSLVPWARGGMFLKWISKDTSSKEVVVNRCKSCGFLESYAK